MERLQHFAAALVAAALAVLCMIVGILGLTVWKPAQEVVASVTPSQPFVMTRDGVLPLFGQSVRVTASAGQDEDVALVVGTPADIMGWIGTSAYTEIIGVESGLTMLKTTDHDSTSAQEAQNAQSSQDAQSGAQEQAGHAQSGDTPQSVAAPRAEAVQSGKSVVTELVSNDMWLREVSGRGSVFVDLKDVPAGQAIMAATESGSAAPTITLTWGVKKGNVVAIVAWILAILFAVAALFLAYRQWRLLHARHERAERIAARENADITDTQAISLEEIADYASSSEKEDADEAEEVTRGSGDEVLPESVDNTIDVFSAAPDEGWPRTGSADGEDASMENETGLAVPSSDEVEFESIDHDAAAMNEHSFEFNDEATYFHQYADMVDSQVGEDVEGTDAEGDEGGDDTASTPVVKAQETLTPSVQAEPEPRVLTIGRHAANGGPIETDPPETVPTDTGTIDLSSIRPGAAVLPSRRALREAREQGLERLVIDGREFDTGLLPVVTRVEETPSGNSNTAESAREEESTANHEDDTPPAREGGWSSLMSSWMKRGTTSEEER